MKRSDVEAIWSKAWLMPGSVQANFAALVLEKAAEVAKSEPRVWDTTAPDPQTRIHDKLLAMAAALQSGDRG